ncbi:MAG: alpha/beta hydrolase [Raineya sp.]|jgi:acetyl esterase/lipase|nr:alpha/beta hydrolase [Raineya sp.]
MPSFETYVLRLILRTLRFVRGSKTPNLEEARKRFRRVGNLTKIHPQVSVTRIGANGVPCEILKTKESQENKLIFFLHGGGYTVGSLDTYRGWLSQLTYVSQIPILAVAYQQAPEHPFPTAPSNALSAYEWALTHYSDKDIYMLGDSAGGGLCLSILLQMREESIKMPKKCILIAPWVDLAMKRDSIHRLAKRDFILRQKDLQMLVNFYAGKENLANPFISPINGDLSNLPPIYIQQGTEDIFLDEVKELNQKLKEFGNDTYLEIWDGMPHVWHVMYDKLPEARKATQKIAQIIQS